MFFFSFFSYRICEIETNSIDVNDNTTDDLTYNPIKFCDDGAHNRYAPTKQNQMCSRRSMLDVILKHADFYKEDMIGKPSTVDTTPKFIYKKRMTTRYVLVLDETRDTMVRESWSFLQKAIRNWVVYDLPDNTEVGIILANETGLSKQYDILPLNVDKNRIVVAAYVPFSPSESQRPACMNCAVREAQAMLEKQRHDYGDANSVILVIAPGMDVKTDYLTLSKNAREAHVRIATINYPGIIHRKPLDALAYETSGLAYTLFEAKQNAERTYLTTYVNLVSMLRSIITEYYEGNRLSLPIEIHRKKLFDITDDQIQNSSLYSGKRSSRLITGTFLLSENMGAPSSFVVYTHSSEAPLISSMTLTSPSDIRYLTQTHEHLSVKQLTIDATINETGTWTYTVDRVNGNPQPHFVQVMASVRSRYAQAITAKAWIDQHTKRSVENYGHDTQSPIVIYVEVKKGELPVVDALVEVVITRPDIYCAAASKCEQRIRITDSGNGDPDITKGDGIYTRYFSPNGGAGTYQFDIEITDNGNTAYSLPDHYNPEMYQTVEPRCCGSIVPHPSKQPLSSFQRLLPTLTVFVGEQQLYDDVPDGVGHIGDLKVEMADTTKIKLSWTAPDMAGLNVARYDVKYAFTAKDIVDNFDSEAISWEHNKPLTFSIGDDTAFSMNITAEPSLIGRTIFIGVRPYAKLSSDSKAGLVSNYVMVTIKPLPPPVLPPTLLPDDGMYSSPYPELVEPYKGELGWALLLIILCAGILIFICLCGFCYLCVLRRRGRENEKSVKSGKLAKHAMINQSSKNNVTNGLIPSPANSSSIHQMPSPSPPKQMYLTQQTMPPHDNYDQSAYTICPSEIPDPHTIGLPMHNSDEEISKERYSIVHDHDSEFLEKLKHDMIYRPCNLNISLGESKSNTLTRNGQILSPYESWTASQLLHEHERRHSSLDDMMNPIMDGDPHHNTDNISLINSIHQQVERLSISNGIGCGIVNTMVNSTPIGPPPVPPLPYTTNCSGYPVNYQIYGNYPGGVQNSSNYSTVMRSQHPPQYQQQPPNGNAGTMFNSSLQGSMCSVHSGSDIKKKTRTITMV